MQPQSAYNQKGIPVKIETGTPSNFVGTAAGRIQPMLVLRQSGEGADYLIHELDMETTSITTTLTEQHTIDNKMVDFDQMGYSVFPSGIMGSAEDSMYQGMLAGNSKTAIFDVQPDISMHAGGEVPPHMSDLVDSVLPSEKLMQPPCMPSIVDCGLPSDMVPCASSMVDSVLSSERPISPSDFIKKDSTCLPQMEDLDMPPSLLNMIDELLAETPINNKDDCIQQLDLDMFSHSEQQQDVLDSIVQEIGIDDEVEVSKCHQERETCLFSVPATVTQVKEESSYHHGEHKVQKVQITTPITTTQPPRIQGDHMGPVQTKRTRRASRVPSRYRETLSSDDEPTTTKAAVKDELDDVIASTSGITPRKRKGSEIELSYEEKYKRNRLQNNLASKRCREKRKQNVEKMSMDLQELEKKNRHLQDKVAQLTDLRDRFREFVSTFLIQRAAQK